jgi:hypothetical protein
MDRFKSDQKQCFARLSLSMQVRLRALDNAYQNSQESANALILCSFLDGVQGWPEVGSTDPTETPARRSA